MRNKKKTNLKAELNEAEILVRNEETKRPLYQRFLRLGVYLVIVLTIFCFARPGFSPTASMDPTIPAPCLCLTAPIYGMIDYEPQRFDVVCVRVTEEQGKQLKMPTYEQLCKRVIGLGGEKLEIINGIVYINDIPLQEDYLPDDYIPNGNFGPYYIPEGHMFLLGDNRDNSHDSRYLEKPYFSYDAITTVTWLCIGREINFVR